MILSALFSGPATLWEGLLVLGIFLGLPSAAVMIITHQIVRYSGYYADKIKKSILRIILYYLFLFAVSTLFWLVVYRFI